MPRGQFSLRGTNGYGIAYASILSEGLVLWTGRPRRLLDRWAGSRKLRERTGESSPDLGKPHFVQRLAGLHGVHHIKPQRSKEFGERFLHRRHQVAPPVVLPPSTRADRLIDRPN